jgi:hypothetical protein
VFSVVQRISDDCENKTNFSTTESTEIHGKEDPDEFLSPVMARIDYWATKTGAWRESTIVAELEQVRLCL